MKKSLFVALGFILSITLVSCASYSVGIIGGADGETQIAVSNESKQPEKKPIRLIRLDGKLYYDTATKGSEEARCGVMDGSFVKAAGAYDVPKNDNECNFSGQTEYQIGRNDTIEIEENDGRTVFKQISSDAAALKYKYACTLSGRTANAAQDSTFVVLSNDENVTFDDAAYHLYGSDTRKMKDIYVVQLMNK